MKIITPEISVIIPVYKAHSTLKRAISSINNQLYDQDKIEIILSIDDSAKYDHFKLLNKNIRILNPSGKIRTGAGEARNRGIKIARGKIIGFLDADDTWSSNYLCELKPIAMRYGMAITKTEILNQNGNHLFTLDPGHNFEIKHFGLLPGSFHPLVLKKLAGPFPDGASQDVIHCINLLKKIPYRSKIPSHSKYQIWLNEKSKTFQKDFSKLVDNSYKYWRHYYFKELKVENSFTNIQIIRVLQKKIIWNNKFMKSNNEESFYKFISSKI